MKIKSIKSSLALILGAALMVPVSAQDDVIEEVIVTATKREQTLQEVPVAVSVTDADVIEKAVINDVLDLQSVVPSLRVTQLQSSANTNFVIRGFGNGANNAGIEPSVGVFIDGVFRSRSAGAISDLPTVQRVEVLRGPQSTLFGKNASAGVISVVTPKPNAEGGGFAEVTLGNFGLVQGKGFVEGGNDKWAYSLGANINQRDGYFDNLFDGSESNERSRWGARAQVLYTPSDTSEYRLIVDADEIDEVCCGVTNLLSGPTGPAVVGIGGALVPNDPFSYQAFFNTPSTNQVENSGISLQADWSFNNFDVTSISSVREQSLLTDQDSDFTSADLLSNNYLDQDISTLTQEIRFSSNGDGKLSWLGGLFYFGEEVELEDGIFYGDDTYNFANLLTGGAIADVEAALQQAPGTFFASGSGGVLTAGQDNTSLSLFGQLDYQVTDNLVATIGINRTRDEKDVYVNGTSTDVFSSLLLDGQDGFNVIFAGAFAEAFFNTFGLPLTPTNAGLILSDPATAPIYDAVQQAVFAGVSQIDLTDPNQNPLLGLQPLQFLPPFLDFPNVVEDGRSEDTQTTFIARLAYDMNDNVNIYGSVGTGFKATSWNLSRDSRPFLFDQDAIEDAGLNQPNQTYLTRFADPEDSLVIEAGIKVRWDRGALNMAVFDQEIKGFQSNIFRGTGFALINAGKQSTKGLELDLTYDITDQLTWTFAGTFLDPVYDSFPEGQGVTGTVDLSGTRPAGIHEISATTSLTYNWLMSNGWDAFIRGDYLYESNVAAVDNVPAEVAARQVNTLNGSFGFNTANGWGFQLWGRNILDDEYLLSAFPTPIQAGSFNGYPNQPATYGITLRKTF